MKIISSYYKWLKFSYQSFYLVHLIKNTMKTILLLFLFPILMNDSLLFDFNKKTNSSEWKIIDDGVMGGLSKGKFKIDENGNGVFFGAVSTENYGGFSSVSHQMKTKDISKFSKVSIRLKGDGKNYQFRIKDNANSYYSYINTFKTSGEWETIVLKWSDLYPSFRGQTLNLPNFKGDFLEEIVFLIGNKKNESFELKIDTIELVK
jgi:NADH dehydrogenase [ubiquinone] 1 alpha subcomplex assembly factor 1